ncbi:class I SAM-dependent methyltransferase [Janibacter cremeus]|uniref:SAM-dependent methyltransferase n=1 Tax=Janibacter cremeus TaxID=1285192 RepID=A0A852VWA3_9MICO|nr:class I SAM-dependent methyltransferase [Janibacter cremeus]NYF98544.1 SAM-dependent methyltransferase [Janibacter cremeus]
MNTDTNAAARSADTALQARINDYWDHRARVYDEAQHREGRDVVDRDLWGRVWASALPPAPARVLDLGTGSGHAAFVLADLGHDVTGVDSSAGMLEIARARTAGTKGASPTFVLGDAVDPPVAGGFDVVVSRYLMWTLREPLTALQRWRALLRPGGVLAVVDSTWFDAGLEGSPSEFIDSYAAVMDDLPLASAESIGATAEVVTAAGFTDVTTRPLTDVLEVDRRLGVAPGHRPRLQYLVHGTA